MEGPAQPDYTGMDAREEEDAKAKYKVERKAGVNKICHPRLKLNVVDKNTGSLATYIGLSPSHATTNVGCQNQKTTHW